MSLSTFGVNGPEDVGAAIDEAKASGAKGLNFLSSPLFAAQGSRIYQIVMERTAAVRLPAIFQWPEMAEAGAVLGYGPPVADDIASAHGSRRKFYVRKPADLPVEQPTKFELVINLKTSKAIGPRGSSGACTSR